jgi:hypothetical protein
VRTLDSLLGAVHSVESSAPGHIRRAECHQVSSQIATVCRWTPDFVTEPSTATIHITPYQSHVRGTGSPRSARPRSISRSIALSEIWWRGKRSQELSMDIDPQPDPLRALEVTRLTGNEVLHRGGEDVPLRIVDFWQWSVSDLVSNLTRGRFAEFIVAHALAIDVRSGVRNEWDAFDLKTATGVKVEVKSAGYVQSWRQKQLSGIAWSLGPTRAWDHSSGELTSDRGWHADVYVLALFASQEKQKADPLDLDQWRFFVVPAAELRERIERQSLTLQAVTALVGEGVGYDGLPDAVAEAAKPGV